MPISRRGFLQGTALAAAAVTAPPVRAGDEPLERLRVRINGEDHTFDVHAEATALEVIREHAGLTGTKESCGHGACGACAIRVNGDVVNACLLPATSLLDRDVTTVEGIGPHAFAAAMAANDGLQCGFCTPGFVVQGADFVDRWRADHGDAEPTDEDVAAALCGHLCRCSAYAGIVAAAKQACTGAKIGPPARVDAEAKLTGAAVYTVDVKREGQLEGVLLRSPHPHARLLRLDLAPALAVPGVKAAVPLLETGHHARYRGQEVAAVAAVDRRAALAGIAAIVAEWEPLPHAIGFDAASAPGAPLVYPQIRDVAVAAEFPLPPAHWEGNRRGPVHTSLLQPERAAHRRAHDGAGVEDTWETAAQCHTALEPNACVADWHATGLRAWISTQACADIADDLAERFELHRRDVQVLCPYVGGAFGAKSEVDPHVVAAVELSRAAGLPVRVVLDRHEQLLVGGYRPAQRIRLALSSAPDGERPGLEVEAEGDSGVAIGASIGALLRLLYPFSHKRLLDWDVVTFAPPARPFRGPGGPPALWAVEQAIERLATRDGVDSVTLREGWDPRNRSLYAWVRELPAWKARDPKGGGDTGRYRRGLGFAAASWYHVVQTNVEVEVEDVDGAVVVRTAAQDAGTGTRSMLADGAARFLGIPRERVQVELGDSDLPRGPMSGGSRSTASLLPALKVACADFAQQPGDHRFARAGRGGNPGGILTPPIGGFRLGRGMPGSVQVLEVEVDTATGRIRILHSWSAFRVGRLASRVLAESQGRGALLQGIGYALYEERRMDPSLGILTTANLEDYHLLGIGDVPEMDFHFDETPFRWAAEGLVGMGEIATLPVAAAIGNAVTHATGWHPTALPLRPDRVLAGVRA